MVTKRFANVRRVFTASQRAGIHKSNFLPAFYSRFILSFCAIVNCQSKERYIELAALHEVVVV